MWELRHNVRRLHKKAGEAGFAILLCIDNMSFADCVGFEEESYRPPVQRLLLGRATRIIVIVFQGNPLLAVRCSSSAVQSIQP